MKKVVLAGAMALVLGSMNVQAAGSDDQGVDLNITVAGTCLLGAATPTGTFDFSGNVDATTAYLTATESQTLSFGDSYCNGGHEVTLSSAGNGMKNTAAVEAGSDAFDSTVNYTAVVNGWAVAPGFTTSGADGSLTSGAVLVAGAFRKTSGLEVQFDTIVPDVPNPLLEGNYTDTVTLTVAIN